MGEMAQQAANMQQFTTGVQTAASAAQAMGSMMGGIAGQAVQQAAQMCALTAINAMAASMKSYVVHGAYTICEYGSRPARLIVPMSHGVYLRGKAQLNKLDCLPGKNVTPMGVCTAGYSNICAEQENAKNEKKSFSISFMGGGKKQKAKEEQIKRATSSVTVCTYMPLTAWLETKEDVLIDGKEALLNQSYLICRKGGKVTILDDGQYS